MEAITTERKAFSIREYMESIIGILRSPSSFFLAIGEEGGMRRSLVFLFISGIFHSTVSMAYFYENSLTMGGIYLLNAMLMPLVAAVFSFVLAGMSPGKKPDFDGIVSVHAYSAGAIMTVSWIPALGAVFEIVRALLVIIGLKRACRMSWFKSVFVVIATAMLLLVFIWSLAPVLQSLSDLLHG